MNFAGHSHARSQDEGRDAKRMRDEFIAIASHELRTPLTPLQLQLQSLAQQAPALARDDAAAEWLSARVATLQRQSDRLAHLVEELLDATHQLAGEAPQVELAPVDLVEIVRAVVARLSQSGLVARAGCTVEVVAERPVVGLWSAPHVEQIAMNLIENALKFGAGAKVEITVSRDGEFARFSVADHGIGVAPADHQRIFERFERAVSVRHYGGFGLGLFLARTAARELGGALGVDSELGQGATFHARLPLAGPRRHRARAAAA